MRNTATLLQAPGLGQRLETVLRVFVVSAALLTLISRCRTLQELATALAFDCVLLRGELPASQIPLKARVQPVRQLHMAEEVYGQRLSLRWQGRAGCPSLLLLLQGRCILEAGGVMLHLEAGGRNAAALRSDPHDFTITQAPCRLVRLLLPPTSLVLSGHGAPIPRAQAWSADLGLLLSMQRLLEQSLHHAAADHTRLELADTLLTYVWDRLASVGCLVELPPVQSLSADPMQQLEVWLPEHLSEPLELADLAAAVNLGPRRLQELCRQRHGCTPMELLRRQRLGVLAGQLRDPQLASRSLAGLMATLQLSDSAATRGAFERLYGHSPAAHRRLRSGPLQGSY